jgi:hypothetical protein
MRIIYSPRFSVSSEIGVGQAVLFCQAMKRLLGILFDRVKRIILREHPEVHDAGIADPRRICLDKHSLSDLG